MEVKSFSLERSCLGLGFARGGRIYRIGDPWGIYIAHFLKASGSIPISDSWRVSCLFYCAAQSRKLDAVGPIPAEQKLELHPSHVILIISANSQ